MMTLSQLDETKAAEHDVASFVASFYQSVFTLLKETLDSAGGDDSESETKQQIECEQEAVMLIKLFDNLIIASGVTSTWGKAKLNEIFPEVMNFHLALAASDVRSQEIVESSLTLISNM